VAGPVTSTAIATAPRSADDGGRWALRSAGADPEPACATLQQKRAGSHWQEGQAAPCAAGGHLPGNSMLGNRGRWRLGWSPFDDKSRSGSILQPCSIPAALVFALTVNGTA